MVALSYTYLHLWTALKYPELEVRLKFLSLLLFFWWGGRERCPASPLPSPNVTGQCCFIFMDIVDHPERLEAASFFARRARYVTYRVEKLRNISGRR